MHRPYETPHDLEEHIEQGFKASDLTMGSDLEQLMIPLRDCVQIFKHEQAPIT